MQGSTTIQNYIWILCLESVEFGCIEYVIVYANAYVVIIIIYLAYLQHLLILSNVIGWFSGKFSSLKRVKITFVEIVKYLVRQNTFERWRYDQSN